MPALAWPEHTDSVHPYLPLPTPAAPSGSKATHAATEGSPCVYMRETAAQPQCTRDRDLLFQSQERDETVASQDPGQE